MAKAVLHVTTISADLVEDGVELRSSGHLRVGTDRVEQAARARHSANNRSMQLRRLTARRTISRSGEVDAADH